MKATLKLTAEQKRTLSPLKAALNTASYGMSTTFGQVFFLPNGTAELTIALLSDALAQQIYDLLREEKAQAEEYARNLAEISV